MSYNGSCVFGLGWTYIVLGSLSVIFGIAADAAFISDDYFTMHQVSAPIWSGVLVIVTGIIGVFSGKSPTNKGLMAAFLPLSIFVILACLVCWAVAASGISVDRAICGFSWLYSGSSYYGSCSAMQALHGVNILLGFTEMVLGFVTSILCCVGMCSSNNVQPGAVIFHQAAPMPGGVVIMQNTGGYPMPLHTAGMTTTYVGGPQPVIMQPVHQVAPPAYTYHASGPINPGMVVHTQSNI